MSFIQSAKKWKLSFLILAMIPIIFIGVIYIVHGVAFNPFFYEHSILDFLKLSNQFLLFESEINLPFVVKVIGESSLYLLNILFVLWLSLNFVVTYLKLSKQQACKAELVLEILLLSLIYYFIISPSNIVLFILGWVIIMVNIILITFYWIYQVKTKK